MTHMATTLQVLRGLAKFCEYQEELSGLSISGQPGVMQALTQKDVKKHADAVVVSFDMF